MGFALSLLSSRSALALSLAGLVLLNPASASWGDQRRTRTRPRPAICISCKRPKKTSDNVRCCDLPENDDEVHGSGKKQHLFGTRCGALLHGSCHNTRCVNQDVPDKCNGVQECILEDCSWADHCRKCGDNWVAKTFIKYFCEGVFFTPNIQAPNTDPRGWPYDK